MWWKGLWEKTSPKLDLTLTNLESTLKRSLGLLKKPLVLELEDGSGKTGAGPGTEVGAGSCTNGALKGSGTELGDKTMWKKKRLREKTPSALGLESAIKKSLCLL